MAILRLDPPEFPSVWANTYGQDRFGLWQALELNGVKQVMRWIPPGEFVMGSPLSEVGREDDENEHDVLITKGFWLAEAACTQVLWQAVMGKNPSEFENRPEHPVENVSWEDCQRFVERANEKLLGELTLRLPTEAEWEYAARAGSSSAFWWGDEISIEQANYDGNSIYRNGKKGQYREQTVNVLEFDANDLGLFQMHGNVFEWCQDYFGGYPEGPVTNPEGQEDGQHRVLRGGSWFDEPQRLRSAYRSCNGPGIRFSSYGFRLAGG